MGLLAPKQVINRGKRNVTNIVTIMAKTGSAALAEGLAVLESDREKFRQEITETELKTAENGKTDRNVLHSAFKQAKEMF